MEQITLKDGRTAYLRRMRASDYEKAIAFLDRVGRESKFTNQYPGRPPMEKEKCVAGYEDDINHWFLGAFDSADQLIGVISFGVNHPDHPWTGRNCSFGLSILNDFWGVGLGTILMDRLEAAARQKNMHRIEGAVRALNRRAISLYLKSGFEIDGLFKEDAFIDGAWQDTYHISKILE